MPGTYPLITWKLGSEREMIYPRPHSLVTELGHPEPLVVLE